MIGAGLIGITGGIGAGKSVVSRILRLQGYEVYDCDLEAKRLMDGSEEVRRALAGRWGEDIYREGRLDRPRVAEIVFGDAGEKRWLDTLVHGLVRDHLKGWMAERDVAGKRLFVESAILYGSGLAEMCSEVWLVTAPLELRLRRVEERSGLSPDKALARINAQMPELRLMTEAGIPVREIVNDGNHSLLDALNIEEEDKSIIKKS